MRAKVAVATINGKAYFLIVNSLKKRNIPFISVIPGDPIPPIVRLVVTTANEKPLVDYPKVIIFKGESEIDAMLSEITRILQGKEAYQKIIIGIDPGEVFGVAVVADGSVIDFDNCFDIHDLLNKVKSILKTVDFRSTEVSVKVGNGVPVYKTLLEDLDSDLPPEVTLEIVTEAGTNLYHHAGMRGRRVRHILSAARIAGREGHIYARRLKVEQSS